MAARKASLESYEAVVRSTVRENIPSLQVGENKLETKCPLGDHLMVIKVTKLVNGRVVSCLAKCEKPCVLEQSLIPVSETEAA